MEEPVEGRCHVPAPRLRLNGVAEAKQHEGLGLGSYIARSLAEHLGGQLETCESRREYVARLRMPVAAE